MRTRAREYFSFGFALDTFGIGWDVTDFINTVYFQDMAMGRPC